MGERDVRLVGVLPTYRRTALLASTLDRLRTQSRPLDHLIVVDNEGSPETAELVRSVAARDARIEYLDPGENKGFAGGVAEGMRRVLEFAADDDWIVLLDDDDPPRFPNGFEVIGGFAEEMRARDPRTAAVGISGGWFDWRRGRMRRVPDDELVGAVPLDHVAGNQLPCFRVGVVRAVGVFCEELFFGFSELEYGLRLWTAGYSLYGHGALWLESRTRTRRLGHELRPSRRLHEVTWRDYYTLRNAIFILRRFGRRGTALRVSFVHGIAKPVANLVVSPSLALRHLRIDLRAIRDGWGGRMGRRIDPDGSFRPTKAREVGAVELSG
jgi:GT2 family glycosyltransferase